MPIDTTTTNPLTAEEAAEIQSIRAQRARDITVEQNRRLLELFSHTSQSVSECLLETDIDMALRGETVSIDEIVPGLEAGEYGVVTSPGGVGKSYLMLRGAVEVAAGIVALGGMFGPAKEGGQSVIYLSLEDNPRTRVQNRLKELFDQMQIRMDSPQAADIRRNLKICNAQTLATGFPGALPVDPSNPPRLIIIDTFKSYTPETEENDSTAVAALMTTLRSFGRLYGAAIVLVHHVNKNALGSHSRGESTAGQERGSSLIRDNARAAWTVWPPNKTEAETFSPQEVRQLVILRNSKANHSEGGNEQWFRKNSSGVPVPIEETTGPARSRERLTPVSRIGRPLDISL